MNAVSSWLLNIAVVAQVRVSGEMLCSLSIRKFLSCKMFDNVHQEKVSSSAKSLLVIGHICPVGIHEILLNKFYQTESCLFGRFFFKLADVLRLKSYWHLLIVEKFR